MKLRYHILIYKLIIATITLSFNLYSQPVLKLDEAIAIGLKNNYDIQLSKNEANINKINNSASSAGMNPNVTVNAGANLAFNNTHLEYLNGTQINNPNSSSRNYSAGVGLNWTVFDGFKMFTTKQKLEEIEQLGEIKYKSQVQQTIYQIISAYYDVVKQYRIYNTIKEVKALSEERMKLGETRFNAGLSAKNELLQAQIDFNTQHQNEILQLNNIAESKRKLIQILNQVRNDDFTVDDNFKTVALDTTGTLNKILDNNPSLLSLKKQIEISKLSSREFSAYNFPFLNLSAGYGYNLTENTTAQVINSRGFGPTIGATISYPLYQGGNISRQVETSELAVISVEIQYSALKNQIITQYQNAINIYNTYLQLLEIEDKTKDFAKENLYIAMERLKLSQTNSLEVRDAQVSYENSLSRLTNIYYNLKLSESQIKLLAGEL